MPKDTKCFIEKFKGCQLEEIYVVFKNGHIEQYLSDDYFIGINDNGRYHIERKRNNHEGNRDVIIYFTGNGSYSHILLDNIKTYKNEELSGVRFARGVGTKMPAYDICGDPIFVDKLPKID